MEKKTEIIEFPAQADTERCPPPQATPIPAPSIAAEPAAPSHGDPIFGAERLERIGGGGFGEVWRVRYLGSEEAWNHIPLRPGMSERTGREAIHARRVNHRNVVRVLDVLRLPDHYVLRMELVKGRDFGRVVAEDGIIPPDEAVAHGLQVAGALAHAHREGVVHLDLKPHNLLLNDDGAKVMVTDFGISASLAPDMSEGADAAGTPYFMAPEQFDDPPSVGSGIDVWSLAVTLYWMMSLSYPFRFDERDAKEVIRRDAPVPLPEVAPHVPDAVWRILERMLEKDPARRPASMDEVVRLFEEYRRSPGHPDERAADGSFALCLFDEAVARYEKASRSAGDSGADRGRCSRLAALARECRIEHDLQVDRADARIADDDPAGALLALGLARRRFSRSPAFRERRERLDAMIRERFASPRRSLEAILRKADFTGARRLLDQIGALLGVPGARKHLRAAGGEDAVVDAVTLGRLRASVDEKEVLHGKLLASVEDAVGAMDFARARDVLEEFQNHFPLPENLDRMRALASAAEGLSFLAEYPLDLLGRLEGGEPCASADRPLLLRKAAARSAELLRAFDPKIYPRFAEIEARGEALAKAIAALQDRAGADVAAIAESHRQGDLGRVRRSLDASGWIILHTDIFPEETRDSIRDIGEGLDSMAQRADRLYREGRGWLERRQFNKALTAFEEALRMGGGSHGDIGFLMRTCTEAAERRRRLSEDLHSLDLTIAAGAACLAEVSVYLQKSEEFLGLQEEAKGSETTARAARALSVALDLAALAAAKGPGRRVEALRELAGTLGGIKPEFVALAVGEAAEVPEKLVGLVRAVLGEDDEGPPSKGAVPPEERIVALHNLVETLSLLGPLLAAAPAPGGPHACETIADEVVGLARSHGRTSADGPMAREILNLLEDLAGLAPPPASERIQALRDGLLRKIRRRRAATRTLAILSRALQFALPLAVATALAAGAILAWSAGERRSEEKALGESLAALRIDPRWKDVDAIAPAPGKDFALALRLIEGDLPAFAGLDRIDHPDARLWARCVAGAGILGWIAPEGAPVLGRSGIRRAIEEAIGGDLDAAVEIWVEEAAEAFPSRRAEADRGFPGLLTRLEIAGKVLDGLGGSEDPEKSSLASPRGRAAALAAAARGLGALVEAAERLPADLAKSDPAAASGAAEAFWSRYLSQREGAPSEGWKKLLDGTAAAALSRGLRASWIESRDRGGPSGPAVLAVLRTVARIREFGGPLAIAEGWSQAADPFHQVLWPLVR